MAINIDKSAKAGDIGSVGFSIPGVAASGMNGADANCQFLGDDCAEIGQVGAPGMNGGPGGQGLPGRNAPSLLIIQVDKFDFDVSVAVNGGAGGKGGRGGDGQQGGQGGQGGAGNDCEFGRHGGSGGKGGDAGQGGQGGDGGKGGAISVLVKEGINPKSMVFEFAGGVGGIEGDPGTPGLPGYAGPDGFTSGWFVTSGGCPDRGPVGGWGAAGGVPAADPRRNGKAGQDGRPPEIKIIP